jgi:hypothetical protein
VDLAREGRRNSLPGTAKFMATPDYRVDYAPRNVLLSHGEAKLSLELQVEGLLGIKEHLIKAIGLLSF